MGSQPRHVGGLGYVGMVHDTDILYVVTHVCCFCNKIQEANVE